MSDYYEFTDRCGDLARLDLRGKTPKLCVKDRESEWSIFITADDARGMIPLLQEIIEQEPKPKEGEVWVIEVSEKREVAKLWMPPSSVQVVWVTPTRGSYRTDTVTPIRKVEVEG